MTTGRINQVAFLSDARRAPHEPAARRTDGTKAKRGRRSQGAFVRFFRADKEPAKAPCPLRLPNPRIPAAARGPRPRTAKRGKAWDARAAFGFAPHAECEGRKATDCTRAMPRHWVCSTGYRRPTTSLDFPLACSDATDAACGLGRRCPKQGSNLTAQAQYRSCAVRE
ncbi:hypothetical protein H5410_064040 [Solanum commersonii]|uniref:Uncharacterized protein n=1 Tax=Solanum commersonii TaxID=4109 RepID=A0A9J5W0W9_SOLCO|nr:hypothetical protein H5410_064040 [Solanum commersonii]